MATTKKAPEAKPELKKVRAVALGFYGPSSDTTGTKHRLYEAGEEFEMEIYPGHEPTWVEILEAA